MTSSPPFVLEVDVDVGRLAALLGHEALEQKVVARGVDRGERRGRSRRPSSPLSRGPGIGCPATGQSGRSSSPSGSTGRSRGVRSGEVRARGCAGRCPADPRGSAWLRLPKSASPAPPAASGRGTGALPVLIGELRQGEAAATARISTVRRAPPDTGEEAMLSSLQLKVAVGVPLAAEAPPLSMVTLWRYAGDDVLQDPAVGLVEQDVVCHDVGTRIACAMTEDRGA